MKACTSHLTFDAGESESTAPHLFVARSGEGHLEVVEAGRPDGVEPVDHLLETTASTQCQSNSRPAGRLAVTLHLFTLCAAAFWERAKWLFFSDAICACTQWCAVQMLQCCRYLRVTAMLNEPNELALAVALIGQQRGRWLGWGGGSIQLAEW